jgi:tetratricopeptide (TPR) repeat protein
MTSSTTIRAALIAGLISIFGAGASLAAASLSPAEIQQLDDDMQAAVTDIHAHRYESAISKLMDIYKGIGADADALNYLGFAHRKLGNNGDALGFYEEALELDPDHLAANEYLGELYVQTGELDKAATQLETLTNLCGACQESEMLAESIAQAQAGETHSSLRW